MLQDQYVRACAHWPNVAQTDLNVFVVIIGVFVPVVAGCVAEICGI